MAVVIDNNLGAEPRWPRWWVNKAVGRRLPVAETLCLKGALILRSREAERHSASCEWAGDERVNPRARGGGARHAGDRDGGADRGGGMKQNRQWSALTR